jgi:hypothetical protein
MRAHAPAGAAAGITSDPSAAMASTGPRGACAICFNDNGPHAIMK